MSERGCCLSFNFIDPKDAAERLASKLEAIGCEVDRTRSGYRVLMFRKKSRRWTQVYEAMKRTRFRISGPERGLAFGLGAFVGVNQAIIDAEKVGR